MALSQDRPQASSSRRTPPIVHSTTQVTAAPRAWFLAAGLGFLLFIVYGSLVPFDFRERSLDAAWQAFQQTPWLDLGTQSRADWVANLLLYIPLGFCFTAALQGRTGRFGVASVAAGIAVFVVGAALAVAIEFTQLFFPPRTVSLNDIAAEFVGTVTGIVLWWSAGERLSRLLDSVAAGGPLAIRAAATVYVLAYVGLSLFPFDFVLSTLEFREKLAAGLYDLFIVGGACGGGLTCMVKLGTEVAAAAPAGFLIGLLLARNTAHPYAKAFAAGCAFGGIIEIAQFFIVSGVSQGISVFTRGAGFLAGIAVQRAAAQGRFEAARAWSRPAVVIAVVPYIGLLMAMNGWFSAAWTDLAGAGAALRETRFLPFYYHYFATEQSALQSLLRIATAYLPVGLGFWLWRFGSGRGARGDAWTPAVCASILALIMEAGRLFVRKTADPTDILIAAFAAWFGYAAAAAVARWTAGGVRVRGAVPGAPGRRSEARREAPATLATATSLWPLLIVLAVSPLVLLHPFADALVMSLIVYAVFLWRYPRAALPAVLALLPILNFAPWTGWVLVDEFDLVVAVTVAVWLVRRSAPSGAAPPTKSAFWPLALLAASYAMSAIAGLLPFQTLDQSVLVTYYGSLNSLRVAKGFIWALALLPMIRDAMERPDFERRFADGILLGLCGVIAVTLWQRVSMAGLLDFSSDYRIAATFPETHIGGGDVEAYLVMALPFALVWAALRPTVLRLLAGVTLFVLGSYALAVTFARAGYLGYAVILAVLAVAVMVRWLRRRSRLAALVAVGGLAAIALAVMIPILSSSFMQQRFSVSQSDGAFRARHWAEAIDIMDPGVRTAVLGMGLGSFPRSYLVRNPAGAVPATFNYLREGENRYLRLGSGEPLYLDQRLSTTAGETYTLSVDLRSSDQKAGLSVALCEKTEQHSFRCKRQGFAVKSPGEKWTHETVAFSSGEVGAASRFLRPPVVLALSNPQPGTRIDVDNVSLTDVAGRELVVNGDFSQGGARWFFTTDNHAQWHIFNQWVHVYFEQGWLGILGLGVAVAVALVTATKAVWRGDLFSAALLAAICGVLVVGLFNSVLDSSRIATLFFALIFAALIRQVPPLAAGTGERHSNPRRAA